MIIGIGNDIIDIERIEQTLQRYGDRFVQRLFTEVERVIQHGFTQSELDREKSDSLHYLDEALADKDKSPSGPLADELVRHVIQDEPVPGIVYEQAMAQRFLPGISLAEVNALAKNWIPEGDRVVAITAPERPGLALPTQARLASVIFTASNARVAAYVDRVSTQPLLAQTPARGTITRTNTRADIGVTEWQLSNGAKVILKPTPYKEDEILFRAYSPGGTSLAGDQDIVPAETADEVVSEGGLGSFSRIDLNKLLAGATTAVRADIGDRDRSRPVRRRGHRPRNGVRARADPVATRGDAGDREPHRRPAGHHAIRRSRVLGRDRPPAVLDAGRGPSRTPRNGRRRERLRHVRSPHRPYRPRGQEGNRAHVHPCVIDP